MAGRLRFRPVVAEQCNPPALPLSISVSPVRGSGAVHPGLRRSSGGRLGLQWVRQAGTRGSGRWIPFFLNIGIPTGSWSGGDGDYVTGMKAGGDA